MKKVLSIMICAGLVSIAGVNQASASSQEEVAQELTTYYRAARGVISKNQAKINNADLGDKGLMPSQKHPINITL